MIRRLGEATTPPSSRPNMSSTARPTRRPPSGSSPTPHHHLLVAYDDDRPVGFVSGVEDTHPDKGTETLLYELGVDEPARHRGFGRGLVEALAALAHQRGCYGMFGFADDDNVAARATYRSAGGRESSRPVMLEWDVGARAGGRR